jgi:hypothetical protein
MCNIFFYDKYKNINLISEYFTINKWSDGYIKVNHKKIKSLKLYGRIIEINELSIDEIQKKLIEIDDSFLQKNLNNVKCYSIIYKKEYECYIYL